MTSAIPPTPSAGAIIVAAGASTRMGGAGDKTLADIGGELLIARTVGVFEQCGAVATVALVVSERNLNAIAALREAKGWGKTMPPLPGGARRQDSVRAGLDALPLECEWVLVHDGARPFVTSRMIENGLAAAAATGAAIAAVPAFDTVKRVAEGGRVVETFDRSELAMVQTPQVFRRDVLERAHAEVLDDVTDDAAMAERIGVEVRTFEGARSNIKVTTPEDLMIATGLLVEEARDRINENKQLVKNADTIEKFEENLMKQSDPDDARYVALTERALDWIGHRFGSVDELDTNNQFNAALYLINAASFNSLRGAIIVLKRGYYAQALALIRVAMESTFFAQRISEHPEPLHALLEGKIGKGDLTLNNMRPPKDPQNKGWWDRYGDLSEMGIHLRTETLRFVYDGDKVVVGGYYSSIFLRGTLYEILSEVIKLIERMQELGDSLSLNWRTDATRSILDVRALQEEIWNGLPASETENLTSS